MIFRTSTFFLYACLLLLPACGGGGGSNSSSSNSTNRTLIGAHYYSWFPSNFRQGYLREKLNPPQEPLLGEYSSRSVPVVEQHIEWASNAGIDFFTLDYWPTREGFRFSINQFLQASNLSKIRFAIFYELWDLGFDPSIQSTRISASRIETMVQDFQYFAENYFTNPQYLTKDGKPIVYLYLTRTLIGDYRGVIETIRKTAREAGFELYLIGDELYWINSQEEDGVAFLSSTPLADRARLFDALFMYNPYAPGLPSQGGYGSESTLLSDLDGLYQRFRELAPSAPVVPMVMPGYNDRGVRPREDNFSIPRRWSPDSPVGSFFEEMFLRSALPNVDDRLPMVLITSWNEWNEDSAIEPLEGTAETTSPESLTEGYTYTPYGETYLDIISRIRP